MGTVSKAISLVEGKLMWAKEISNKTVKYQRVIPHCFFLSFVGVNNVYISMNAIKIRERKNKSTNVC